MKIERLEYQHIEKVKTVKIADEQIKFVGTPTAFLKDGSENVHLHVIVNNGDVVGFFKIDTGYAENYLFCALDSLGLRAFVIDSRQQGKGVGTKAMLALKPYLQSNYSDFSSIYLTVNCKNPAAVRVYEKAGFIDTQELYLGGSAGPQHIMWLSLE